MSPRVLVAGIGNIFLGDDAFGVAVAQRLLARPQPEGVRVIDFGIRGLDLAYTLCDGWETVILLDATPRGGSPGTLYVIEPDMTGPGGPEGGMLDAHGLDPARALRLAAGLGGTLPRVLLLGCEPETFGGDEGQMGLSDAVQAAVDEAVPLIASLVERLLAGNYPTPAGVSQGIVGRIANPAYHSGDRGNKTGDMHELSIALSILNVVEEEARRHGEGRVVAVHLKVGPLAGVIPEALRSAYELAREGSSFPDSRLVIEEVPLVGWCPACAGERPLVSMQQLCCPDCGTPTPEIIRGRELDIVAFEVES
jgi:hydrogenase maturation protease